MAEVKTHFRPEFVNRIDEIVVFQPLARERRSPRIAKIQLKALEARLAKLEIKLSASEAALEARRERRVRPGLRRAAAEARDPAADRESARRRRSWREGYAAGDTIKVGASGGDHVRKGVTGRSAAAAAASVGVLSRPLQAEAVSRRC